MSEVDDRVDELLQKLPLNDSRHWCESPEGCACMGCVNVSHKVPITKAQWKRWLFQQRLTETDLNQLADASGPEHIIIRKLIHTIRAIQCEWEMPSPFVQYAERSKNPFFGIGARQYAKGNFHKIKDGKI